MAKEIILRVKDLRISFRTVSGLVQAVRGVSFNLAKGSTLAIVGESGSGKSVTNRAIIGLLAKNAIVESGEILYNGVDLLKISEKDFCKIRGDKIAMIFQDPLSSLNPIIRIGRQLTEASLLKNKANRRDAKSALNSTLEYLQLSMAEASGDDEAAKAKQKEDIELYRAIEREALPQLVVYNKASSALDNALADVKDLLFNIENKVAFDLKELLREYDLYLRQCHHPYVFADEEELKELIKTSRDIGNDLLKKKAKTYEPLLPTLKKAKERMDEIRSLGTPDFFAYCYCALKPDGNDWSHLSIKERSEKSDLRLQKEFLVPFTDECALGIKKSHENSIAATKEAIKALTEAKPLFDDPSITKKNAVALMKKTNVSVMATIDHLELVKDSYSYTFLSAMGSALDKYYGGLSHNIAEEARFSKQSAQHDKKVAAGKKVDWKPVPANVVPRELLIKNVDSTIEDLIDSYGDRLASAFDSEKASTALVHFLREQGTLSVYKLTKPMAKTLAIKLLKEVGIPEPRKRFRQYPFEFSGGMRQRIVIAIALAANPEILICDEPTTALDVTIQAQILELINKIKAERNLSVIFITHNLGIVANMADRIAVMYAGKIVEVGNSDDIFYDPRHPYTWALLSSMPDLETKEKLEAIPGTPPNMIYPPKGDAFAPRNKYALNIDFEEEPPLYELSPTHYASTWLCDPRAPHVEMPKIVSARIAAMKAKYGKDIAKEEAAYALEEEDEAYKEIAVKVAPKGGKDSHGDK